jgi:hypothetical protein
MPIFDKDTSYWKAGEVDNLSLGTNGAKIVTDTSAQTGEWYAIQIVEDAAFSALTGFQLQGTWTGVTFPAGQIIFGRFTAFTLSSGKVVAYRSDVDGA